MKRKQILSGLLTLTLCLTQLPATTVTVRADDTEQKPSVNNNDTPDDTSDDYYEISTAGQLLWLADNLSYVNDYNAKLMNDIDLTTADQDWTPICDGTNGTPYTSTFDGNNHTISGLNLNGNANTESVGLFGLIGEGGVVKDLTVTGTLNVSSQSNFKVGSIAGQSSGTIEHCTSEVTVTATGSDDSAEICAGGIVGTTDEYSVIRDCVVNAAVSATATTSYAGGIAGQNYGKIERSYLNTTASVTATGSVSYAGGITGLFGAGSIQNCFIGSGINVSSDYSAGGITAYCHYNFFCEGTLPTATIDRCYSLATINSDTSIRGAIIGYVDKDSAAIATDCYYNSESDCPAYYDESQDIGDTTNLTITGMTSTEFRSGAVAWKLNGESSEGIWKQTIEKDTAPAFTASDSANDTVYNYTNCKNETGYSNTANMSSDHVFNESGMCSVCFTSACVSITRGSDKIYYLSFANACGAAQDGDTITLLYNDTDTGSITLNKNNLTLDLQTSSIQSSLSVNGGSLNIKSSTGSNGGYTCIPELSVNGGTVTLCASGDSTPLFGKISAKDGVDTLLESGFVYYDKTENKYCESDPDVTELTNVSVRPVPFTLGEITADQSSCIPGTKVTFSISVDGSRKDEVQYKWEYSTDGGQKWREVDGANAKTYTDTLQSAGTYQIRCEVSMQGVEGYPKTAILEDYEVTAYTISNVDVHQDGTLTYNGTRQRATVSATATAEKGDETEFYYSTDANGSFGDSNVPEFTDAGRHTVYYQVKATNHTTVTGSFIVTIDPLDLSTGADVTLDGTTGTYVYNGKPQSISVSVKCKTTGNELNPGDYTVSGKSETDAGTYSVTIAGSDNGNCTGGITPTGTDGKPLTWTISKKELEVNELPTITISRGEGSTEAQTVDLKAALDAKYQDAKPSNFRYVDSSTINTDYMTGSIDPDTGELTITYAACKPTASTETFTFRCDSQNYDCKEPLADGTMKTYGYLLLKVQISFVKDLSKAEISADSCTYNGSPQTPAITVTCGGQTLTKDTDYTLSCDAQTDAGTYTLTVKGKGDYAGTATQSWSIDPLPLTDAVVTQSGSLTYNGSPQTPAVTVTCNGQTLTKDTDYTVNCTPQTDVSDTYSVTVSGKADSNYTGEASGSWAIKKAAAPTLADISVTRSVSASKPTTVNVGSLRALPYQTPATGFTLGTYDTDAMELSLDAATGILTIRRADGAAGDTLTVPIRIDSTNYKTTAVNVVLTLSNKTEQTLTVTINGWTVGAAANTPSYPTSDDAGAVSVTYMGRGETVYAESTTAPTEAGDYTVCVHYETDSAICHGTADFSITKPASSSGNSGSSGSGSSGSSGGSGGGGAAGGAPTAPDADKDKDDQNASDKNTDFADVPADSAYYDAVSWAARMGITDDADATHFRPESTCSGTQVITCLWRAAGSPDAKKPVNVSGNDDDAKALAWAMENGIISGISIDQSCTRSRAAACLIRYAAANGKNPLVLHEWLFSPSDAAELFRYVTPLCPSTATSNRYCTKGQLMQMLYRILGEA